MTAILGSHEESPQGASHRNYSCQCKPLFERLMGCARSLDKFISLAKANGSPLESANSCSVLNLWRKCSLVYLVLLPANNYKVVSFLSY